MSVTFEDAVVECFEQPEFMEEYRRLTGSTLGLDGRAPIVRMIDDHTGHDPHEAEWAPFFRFVFSFVWMPIVLQEPACL